MKIIILSLCLFFTISFSKAQNQGVADSVAKLYGKYFELANQYNSMREEVNVGVKSIRDIEFKNLLNVQNRYEKNKKSVMNTANFIEAFNGSLDKLELSIKNAEYFTMISSLSNPNNEELGFKLESVILKLVDDKIIKGNSKFNNKNPSRFKQFITKIFNNPLTNVLTSLVPGVSTIKSAVDLVLTTSVQDPSVDVNSITDFQQGLQKYGQHYEKLAEANKNLSSNVQNLRVKTDALRKLTNDFVKDLVVSLYKSGSVPDLNTLEFGEVIEKYYTYSRVQETILQLERTNKTSNGNLDYEELLEKHVLYSSLARNKVNFITENLETLSNEYISAMNENHEAVIQILKDAKELTEKDELIDAKIASLDENYTGLIKAYSSKIEIPKLKSRLNAIPIY